jgi:hypothetical protein
MTDARAVGEGVAINRSNWEEQLAQNLRGFADRWTERQAFKAAYAGKSNEQYVERLYANAGITPDDAERSALVNTLNNKTETRAGVLWKVVNNEAFARKDSNAALVLMNYFGYLRRNPDDSPDNNLNGYNFWLKELEQSGDRNRITNAFMDSSEYKAFTVK